MNRKLNAVALANKRLSEENRELWERNDALERGTEEQRLMYAALVMQLVMEHKVTDVPESYEIALPKVDVAEMAKTHRLEARYTDDGIFLRVTAKEAE